MPRFNGRWCVAGLICALAVACASEDSDNVPDPKPRGGKGGTTGGGGNGGSISAGTSGAGNAGGSSGSSGTGGSSGSAGSGGSSGSAGTAGSSVGGAPDMGGAGGDTNLAGSPGVGGEPGAGGTPGSAGEPGAGGTPGSAGEPGAGGTPGAGGEPGMAGAGGAGNLMCEDGIKNGNEAHIDCGDAAGECGDCSFPLTRYIEGNTGNMGTVTITWDATNLYYYFDVVDSTAQNDSALHWEDDSVELYLDLNNGKSGAYQSDDHQITIARGATDIQGNYGDATIGSIVVVRTTDAAGYTLDVTIPWAALGLGSAPVGQNIGFDFAVNNDTDGGTRNSQIMVFGDTDNHQDTTNFGTITIR